MNWVGSEENIPCRHRRYSCYGRKIGGNRRWPGEKGEITVEQGKILNEELKRDVSDKVKKAASNIQGKEPVEKIADRVGEMTVEERALLRRRLEEAESRDSVEGKGGAECAQSTANEEKESDGKDECPNT